MVVKMSIRFGALAFLAVVSLSSAPVKATQAPQDIAYGQDSRQMGTLWLPAEPGAHPVVVLIHGGGWQRSSNLIYTQRVATELARHGFAVWNIEYRAIGDAGGGYPGTFQDVGAATDHLREMAKSAALDLSCIVAVGHSAGGHLALWLAARNRLPPSSPLSKPGFLPVTGAVDLAGPPNLRIADTVAKERSGSSPIGTLIGAQARGFDAALKDTSPAEMLPLGVPQVLIFGGRDDVVPADQGTLYKQDAAAKGESVELRILPQASHFDYFGSALKVTVEAIRGVCASGRAR